MCNEAKQERKSLLGSFKVDFKKYYTKTKHRIFLMLGILVSLATAWLILIEMFIVRFIESSHLALEVRIARDAIFITVIGIVSHYFIKQLVSLKSEINESNVLVSAIMNSSPEIIVFALDKQYCYTAFNDMHEKMMREIRGIEIRKGMNLLDVLPDVEERVCYKAYFDRTLNGEIFSVDQQHKNMDGVMMYWQNYYSPIRLSSGEIVGLTCFELNITILKQAEQEKIYLSYHDFLTRLYNRRYYDLALEQLDNPENYPLSVIMADMNGLKFTNDIFGHSEGDSLIKIAAKHLNKVCRPKDVLIRLGGDEFVLLLPHTDAQRANAVMERINRMADNYISDKLVLSISLGSATKTQDTEYFDQIFKKADDLMYNNKVEHRTEFESKLLKTLTNYLFKSNPTEKGHASRVRDLCLKIGQEMMLREETMKQLETASFLHDIGKVNLDESLLLKVAAMNEYERLEITRHCETGYKILNYIESYREIAKFVLHHHEHVDGTGYPGGLQQNNIPLISRIISVADAYDAMTQSMPYHRTMTKHEAVKELKAHAGTQFDAKIVRVLVNRILKNDV